MTKKYNSSKKSPVIVLVILVLSLGAFYFDFHIPVYVSTCDVNGNRIPMARVDVGVDSGDINRNYYGYTNLFGQLVKVTADELILQTKSEEKENGRYCDDEASVPGVQRSDLDQGHVIGDALGGAANAYNITPENSYLNRKGSKYNLEQEWIEAIKNDHKITNLEVEIIYPSKDTQIPNKYIYTWQDNGVRKKLEIDNKE